MKKIGLILLAVALVGCQTKTIKLSDNTVLERPDKIILTNNVEIWQYNQTYIKLLGNVTFVEQYVRKEIKIQNGRVIGETTYEKP